MKIAPNKPPLHAHNGMRIATLAAGTGSRKATARSAMHPRPTR